MLVCRNRSSRSCHRQCITVFLSCHIQIKIAIFHDLNLQLLSVSGKTKRKAAMGFLSVDVTDANELRALMFLFNSLHRRISKTREHLTRDLEQQEHKRGLKWSRTSEWYVNRRLPLETRSDSVVIAQKVLLLSREPEMVVEACRITEAEVQFRGCQWETDGKKV